MQFGLFVYICCMQVPHPVYEMLQRAARLSEAEAWAYALRDNTDLQEQILQSLKRRLFDYGTDENNRVIGVYSPYTQKIDREKVAGTPYTLKDTGEFYASMYIGVLSDHFFIDADGDKGNENLFTKYGEGIIGLNDDQLDWLGEEIITKYLEYVERVLYRD